MTREKDHVVRRVLRLSGLFVALVLHSWSAFAIDFGGTISLFATTLDNNGVGQDQTEQRYNFSLSQPVSPFLTLFLGYSQLSLDTASESAGDLLRDTREPRFEIRDHRPRLSGFVGVSRRSASTELPTRTDAFDVDSLRANVSWRPAKGPRYQLSFRDEKNVGDLEIFGRDTRQQVLTFETSYNRRLWGGSYLFQRNNLENQNQAESSDQNRHELRLRAFKDAFDDRLRGSISTSLAQIDRETVVGSDGEIGDPIPPAQGLFVIDPSPELGELDPAPTLIDGDVQTPTSPQIDIGAANSFRNIGLDLGLTQPITRLQIYVNIISSPGVIWQVYRSSDNLVWDVVDGTTSDFDDGFLRYTIRLPETTARFFKVVNLSSNAIPEVLVTEARALIDVDVEAGRTQFESNRYSAAGDLVFLPTERIVTRLNFSATNNQDFAAGLVRRDYEALHAGAGLRIGLARNLDFDLGYSFDDSENLRPTSPLLRTINRYSTGLRWTPLPTVDVVLSAQHRDESQESQRLNSEQGVRLFAVTDLLPGLRLQSNLAFARFSDTLTHQLRDSWNWAETLQAQPYQNWRIGGTFSLTRYQSLIDDDPSGARETVFNRSDLQAFTTWTPTAFLSLSGTWFLSDLGGNGTVNQIYNISYAPGPKLFISGSYSDFSSSDSRSTGTNSINATYRLTRFLTLVGNLSRSETQLADTGTEVIRSARIGVRLFF